MPPLKNNVRSTLVGTIDASTTSITLVDSTAFPAGSDAGGAYYVGIWDSSAYSDPHDDPNYEYVRIVSNSGNVLTADLRGADGTMASAHSTPGRTYAVEMLLSAGNLTGGDTIKVIESSNQQTRRVWVHALEIGADGIGVLCNEDITIHGSSDEAQLGVRGADNQASSIVTFSRSKSTVITTVSSWRPDGGGYLRLFDDRSSSPSIGEYLLLDKNPNTFFNDDTTAASGTASADFSMFGIKAQIVMTATNADVTQTNAATLSITGAPIAGTNVTITNPFSLWVQSGKSKLKTSWINGQLTVGSSPTARSGIDVDVKSANAAILLDNTVAAKGWKVRTADNGDFGILSTTDFSTYSTGLRISGATNNVTVQSGLIVTEQADLSSYISFEDIAVPIAGVGRPKMFMRLVAGKWRLSIRFPSGATEDAHIES
jgi:hypothetical protein